MGLNWPVVFVLGGKMHLNKNVVTIKGVDEKLQSVMDKYQELRQTFNSLSDFGLGIELKIDHEASTPKIGMEAPEIDKLVENIHIHRYKLQEFEEIVKSAQLTIIGFSENMNQSLK